MNAKSYETLPGSGGSAIALAVQKSYRTRFAPNGECRRGMSATDGSAARGQAGTAARPARVRAMMVFMICAVPSPIWNPSTSRSRCSIGPRS